MPDTEHIVVVGAMGSGKTTLARGVAGSLDREFFDSDVSIRERTGRSGRDIAETEGVAALHELELEVLFEALARPAPAVVAAAASVIEDPRARDALGDVFTVWVTADPEILARRSARGTHRRQVGRSEHLEKRDPLFAHVADLIVDTGALSEQESVDRVLGALGNNHSGAEFRPHGVVTPRQNEGNPGEPFLLGVNYWPRRKAMYWWSDFDRGEVAEELDVIASIGMSVVRVFLLWDDWQPSAGTISADRLIDLGTTLDLAAERGLGLDVTFFTGHMSGPNWSPGWLLDPDSRAYPSPHVRQVISGGRVVDSAYRNMFHDPVALDAERLLLKTVVGEYADHPGMWMWNLGNEPDLFAHPHSADAGRAWVREMTGLIKDSDQVHSVTTGLHTASLFTDNGLRVDHVFAESDVAVMHGYPMYVDWARDPLDPDFVPYLCALVTALSGKPCLAEEWGGCTSPDTEESVMWEWESYGRDRAQLMAGEEALAGYVGQVLPRLVEVGATGALLWCFADYVSELWDRPPCEPGGAKHERHFGLVRPDGSLKPHAEAIRKFAATNPTIRPPAKTVALDIGAEEYYLDPAVHARRLYHDW